MRRILSVSLSLTLFAASAGMAVGATITTLAGDPLWAGSADGTGNAAKFYYPTGVAVDSAGNTYVADQYNHTIRKVTSGGVVTTLAGSAGNLGSADGTGSAARFNFPTGVAVDSAGNLYVADRVNHTIRKITNAGVVTTLAGLADNAGSADGTGSAARFNYPFNLAVDNTGNVYVADRANHTIRKITSAGVVTTLAGLADNAGSTDGTGSAARFNFPTGVTVDGAGNVHVADFGNQTIRKITSVGVVTTLAGSVSSPGSTNGTGSAARFNNPTGVAVDVAGFVYVADYSNHMIRIITSDGVVSTLAGSPGDLGSTDGTGSAARFNFPTGLAVNSTGFVYVADTVNHTIRQEVTGDNSSPTASFTLSSERMVGQSITATVTVGDPNHNYSYATFWVLSPTRGWIALKADNSLLVGGALAPANTVAAAAGTHARTFAFTPTDGPGTYTFALTAVDSAGLSTSAAQQSITVTDSSNLPPSASFSLSSERQLGQTITATVNVGDPNGNYSYATFWVLSPTRGWIAIRTDNSLAVGGALAPSNTVAVSTGSHARTFAFTPTDGPGTYTFALTAVDSAGLSISAAQQSITVTDSSNLPPTASFSLSSERQLGQTITATVNVGDPNGNYSYAALWVLSPTRGWIAIKADNSLVIGGALAPANTVAASAGSHARTFAFTPTDGPGSYTFALMAVDSAGLSTSAVQQSITVTDSSNLPPTASFTLSSERQVGQTITATVNVGDPNGNYSYATLWVLSPTRGWIAIKADNSLVVGGALSPANTVAASAGSHARTFAFTPTDGPGNYTFALMAVDSAGLSTSAVQQSITIN